MKTKFALLFLPALMALSSCGAASKPVANKTILEDTTAHSEIFGNRDVVGGKLGIRNRDKGEAISEPKIGYQIQYDSGTDMLAIRFVAAIKDLNVKAYWRRGVAGADGSELRNKSFANSSREVSNYYLSLSDGNTTITAGAEGDYADYVGFVVYSIYNIPYTANKNAYVAAYVNLVGDEDGDSNVHNNSKALAVRIEKDTDYTSKNVFAFDPTVSGHFLEGTINGVLYDGGENGLYRESNPANKGDNNAWYEKVPLKTTDCFGAFYYSHDSSFEFFGNKVFFDTAVDYIKESELLTGYNSAKTYDGYYTLYVSSGNANHFYPTLAGYQAPLYFYGGGNDFWDGQIAVSAYKVYLWGTGGTTDEILSETATIDGKTVYEITKFDAAKYQNIKIDRCNKDNLSEVWDSTGNQEGFYNYVLSNGPYNYFKVTGWNNSVGWGSYSI